MSTTYGTIASDETINKAAKALEENGFKAVVVDSQKAAKEAVLKLIPKGSDVFTNTSVTLDETGISDAINGSDEYVSARNKMMELWGDPEKKTEMKRVAAAPTYTLGSVHALTQDGKLLVASASGSQIPSESFGAENVIFVVGAQKIVKDLPDGINRIEQHTVPLENERAKQAYGAGTVFAKLLILNKEVVEGRTTVFIIKEHIGF